MTARRARPAHSYIGLSFAKHKMNESGLLEEPKTAAEAEVLAKQARTFLSKKKKKSLRDVVFAGVYDQRARDWRDAEERGEQYVPRHKRSLASRIVKFARDNPDWDKEVEEAKPEEKEDDGEDETQPLVGPDA